MADAPGSEASLDRRILLVEDDFLIGTDLRHMLEGMGFMVVGPIPGLVASIEAARTIDVEAAMVDVTLDGGDSFAVAEELDRRGIPYAFVTGYWSKVRDNPQFVARPVVQKPFDRISIQAALRACGLPLSEAC